MATISITVPDPAVPRIVAAFEDRFDRNEGESAADFVKRVFGGFTLQVVKDYESRAALEAAQAALDADVEADITLS